MKKYYWIALLAGLLIGVLYLFFGSRKDSDLAVKPENLPKEEKTIVSLEDKGDMEVVTQVMGYVENWEPKEAKLTVNLDGEEKVLLIDPLEAQIFIPVTQKKTNQIIVIDSRENENWETAFCKQDSLTVGFDKSGTVRLISGSGYRACGPIN